VSPRTAIKRSTLIDHTISSSSAATCAEDSMQATEIFIPMATSTCAADAEQPSPVVLAADQATASETLEPVTAALLDNGDVSDDHVHADGDADNPPTHDTAGSYDGIEQNSADDAGEPSINTQDLAAHAGDHSVCDKSTEAVSDAANPESSTGDTPSAETEPSSEPAESAAEPSEPCLPDPSHISARLKNLVVSVSQVEELSRRAREAAADDLALYSGIAASQRQFEEGLAEARRIGQEAQAVYQRAFGREARAVAEPAADEAREVEQAFLQLAGAWRNQAGAFLADHPDVEALLAEQRQQDDEARRREVARAKAQRFQQLVTATDAALRQGLLDDARDCLKLLGREFPTEAARVAPLQDRLDHRIRAANDEGARRVMLQASEFQGRGEFDAAVKLLEAVEVQGLSRETSEDVFGRWSAGCSLLGQVDGIELLRSSSTQGRGVILQRDPSVPYGLVVFSSLGMGPSYFKGRVVSAADREGGAIVARARTFRAAEFLPELSAGWYGRSYVTSSTSGAPVRH
jgi:hypothetical protein